MSQQMESKIFKTLSKCINTQGSYWCHCPDYFTGGKDDQVTYKGLWDDRYNLMSISSSLGPLKITRRKQSNLNLVSCRLALTCSSQGFGQTKTVKLTNQWIQATRGALNGYA